MGANAPGLADRIGFEPVLRKWRGRGSAGGKGQLFNTREVCPPGPMFWCRSETMTEPGTL